MKAATQKNDRDQIGTRTHATKKKNPSRCKTQSSHLGHGHDFSRSSLIRHIQLLQFWYIHGAWVDILHDEHQPRLDVRLQLLQPISIAVPQHYLKPLVRGLQQSIASGYGTEERDGDAG